MSSYYYEVWVGSNKYHNRELLTYNSDAELEPGDLVMAEVKRWQAIAIVYRNTGKPTFATKSISSHLGYRLPISSLELLRWLNTYYPGSSGITTQLFLPPGVIQEAQSNQSHEDTHKVKPSVKQLPKLTQDQITVVESITNRQSYILHGRTGSGKTRIYQELALRAFNESKSSIILTPEISMTAQLYKNFEAIFKENTILIHSNLTSSVRRNNWLKILHSKQPIIIIGTRSALFSPIKNLGLIVLDEAHEPAYKQDSTPYYQTNRVASKLREINESVLVFGTATPLVSDYYIAKHKNIPILNLDQPAISKTSKPIDPIIVDLKDRSHFRHAQHISDELYKVTQEALARQEQVLLFLNRRGTAHVVMCQNCGWQATCPNCDVPLTYHGDSHKMRCHSCNFSQPSIVSCPKCQSSDIIFKSVGTKAINDEVKKLFPNAKIMRFDTDNNKAERFEENYNDIVSGKVDIIIGTQTLAKGLDLPKLSVVGVITADTGLYIPDFMAQERTYQLISQVIGRTSRAATYGTAIIQTYSPNSPILKAALNNSWKEFYELELEERRNYSFPPFCYMLKLSCRRVSPISAQNKATQFANTLRNYGLKITIDGPAPSFHEKHGTKFEWQLIIKSKNRKELIKVIDLLPADWSYDIDPINLL